MLTVICCVIGHAGREGEDTGTRSTPSRTLAPTLFVACLAAARSLLVLNMSQYGYTQDEHGQFEGVMGALQRYKCDMLATAIQPRLERIPVTDLIAETYKLG